MYHLCGFAYLNEIVGRCAVFHRIIPEPQSPQRVGHENHWIWPRLSHPTSKPRLVQRGYVEVSCTNSMQWHVALFQKLLCYPSMMFCVALIHSFLKRTLLRDKQMPNTDVDVFSVGRTTGMHIRIRTVMAFG